MTRRWPLSRIWILLPVVACAFVLWKSVAQVQRIKRVSEVGAEQMKRDPASLTGYQHGVRKLIVPEHNAVSYQWIVQTQQMLARGDWRLRHVEYDNAPTGRDSHHSSLYRWWLGLVAKSLRLIQGGPIGIAVESAALWAGPLLHLLIVLTVAWLTGRSFGWPIGAVMAVGFTALFPLGAIFVAGQPDDFALSCAVAFGSVCSVLAGVRVAETAAANSDTASAACRQRRRCFLFAGILGGLGLWINARVQVPVLIGIILGGIMAEWLSRPSDKVLATSSPSSSWRTWALAGSLTSATTYLLEYFPSNLDVSALRLEVNHPLYALAWLGAGELMHQLRQLARTGKLFGNRRDSALLVGALLTVATVPVAIWLHSTKGFLAADPADPRLGPVADVPVAANLWEWLQRDGFTWKLIVTCLPLLVMIPAVRLLIRDRSLERSSTKSVAVALGPVVIVLIFACLRLRFWGVLDALLLVLLAAALTSNTRSDARRTINVWAAGALLCFLPGLLMLRAPAAVGGKDAVTELEAQSLVERDLAHWLSQRGSDEKVIVLAPPSLTSSLIYFGGIRGLATPYWENFDGFAAAVRIAGATSMAEADSLMRRREVKFIVIPSWDSDLTNYASLGTTDAASSLIGRLERWLPPLSLRPMAYKLPLIAGFEGRSIAIFGATDMQDDALALSRLSEYFVEMGQLDFALRVSRNLELKYPEDLNGLIARAQVAAAANDTAGFGESLSALIPVLERSGDEELSWDRRAALSAVLAQAKRPELAREQLQTCLEEADETLLRSLSTGALYRFLVLMQRLNVDLPDPELRELARQLLPAELRDSFQP